MKKFISRLLIGVWLLFAVGLLGFAMRPGALDAATGINHTLNFQGKVTNPDGTNVPNGSYTFVFKIYSVSSGGSAIWTESKSLTTTNGIFQTNLGDATTLPGSVDFNTDNIYLGMNFNSDGEMTPRIRFSAVAQAFNSEKLNGLTSSQFARVDVGNTFNGANTFNNDVTISSATSTAFQVQGGGGNALWVDASSVITHVGWASGTGDGNLVVHADGSLSGNAAITFHDDNAGLDVGSVYYDTSDGSLNIASSVTNINSSYTNIVGAVTLTDSLIVHGNTILQPTSNSATAFQVQNNAAQSLFKVDTLNNNITIGGNNSGMLQPWTSNGSSGLAARESHTSVTANGYMYVIGGTNAGAQSTVYYAKINADGSVGAWTTTTALPTALAEHTSVVSNGYVYVMGGAGSSAVYYAKLNGNGTVGAWQTNSYAIGCTTAGCGSPVIRRRASSVTANGYVYILGGGTSAPPLSGSATVYYAKLNADGSTGAWGTTTSLSGATAFNSTVTANGYMYVTGGIETTGGFSTTTFARAALNADGTVGSWVTSGMSALPQVRSNHTSVVSNGYIYVMGGSQSGAYQSTVYYAKLNNDGTAGAWSTNSYALGCATAGCGSPAIRIAASAVVANGYIYEIGGNNNSTTQSTVYYASTQRIQVGGALDLVGLAAGNLADGETGVGGELTAGNTNIVGSLNVQGSAAFSKGAVINGPLSVGDTALFKNKADSTIAFQIQNSGGTSNLFSADTTNSRIGIGTTTPAVELHVVGIGSTDAVARFDAGVAAKNTAPAYAGTVVNDASAGSIAWTNPSNAAGVSDGSIATRSGTANAFTSNYLKSTGYGFSIPTSATITGIVVESKVSSTGTTVKDNAARLVKAGTIGSTDKSNATNWSSTLTWLSHGSGTTDLWGDTWTPSDINNANFGAALAAQCTGVGACTTANDANVDSLRITVYYTDTATNAIGTQQSTGKFGISSTGTLGAGNNLTIDGNGSTAFKPNVNSTSSFQVQDSSGTTLLNADTSASAVTVNGSGLFKNASNSSTAFAVQNSSSQSLFGVDTANNNITIGGNNSGELQSWTTSANAITGVRFGQTSVIANGYVYVIGGTNTGDQTGVQSTVYYAKLNADGSTGTWTTNTNALPAARYTHASVTANGYVYVMGGIDGSNTVQSTIYYAKLNTDGSTGTWTTSATPLPAARSHASAVVANGYVYVTGGTNTTAATGAQSTVYYAKLNADGSIGAWATSANPITATRVYHSAVTANGYVYIIGGTDSSNAIQSTIYYAKLNADGTTGTWTTNANALTANRRLQRSVVVNGYLYVIGGSNTSSASAQSTIYYGALNSSTGAIGAWTTNTNALPAARDGGSAVTANGYVYALGGRDASPTTQSTVYYASTQRIKVGGALDLVGLSGGDLADGETGTGGELTAGNTNVIGSLDVRGRASFGQGVSIDKELTAGGSVLFKNASNSSTAFMVQNSSSQSLFGVDTANNNITIGGNNSGELQSWTTSANALTAARKSSASVNANGYVYVLGGEDVSGVKQSTVYYAKLNADGSNGTWTTSANALPQILRFPAAVVSNGYIYITGGDNSGAQSTVYYAKLNADGSNGTWQTNSYAIGCATAGCGSPVARYQHTSVVANGYLYVIGGQIGGTGQSTVYYAKLNADGSTGAWSTNSYAIACPTPGCGSPVVRFGHSSVVANGYVYVMGGWNGSVDNNTVYYAKLNADGSTGAWTTSGSTVPVARSNQSSVVANGYVYFIGGTSSNVAQSAVYYSKLNNDGSIGSWATDADPLTAARDFQGSVVENGYIYLLGGRDTAGTAQSTVYYASTQRIKVGGALDLVGYGAGTMYDGETGVGGELSAGNTNIVGSLNVQGPTAFNRGVVINGPLTANDQVLFKNAADSAKAFQIQNSGGTTVLNTDTTTNTITVTNLVITGSIVNNGSGDGGYTGARVYDAAGGQTWTTAQYPKAITFNSERQDSDGFHSTSSNTSRLTATKAGVYTIGGTAAWTTSTTGDRYLEVRVNGSTVVAADRRPAGTSSGDGLQSISTQYYLNAGDYAELVPVQYSGGTLTLATSGGSTLYPEFYMYRISSGSAGSGSSSSTTPSDQVRAYNPNGTNISIINNTWTSVTLASEEYDSTNMHDTSSNTSRITFSTAGTYSLTGNYYIGNSTTGVVAVKFIKNGTTEIAYHQVGISTNGATLDNIVTTAQFNAGDYVEMQIIQTSGSTLTIVGSPQYTYVAATKEGGGSSSGSSSSGGASYARGYNNANQSVSNNTWTVLSLNSEDNDTDGFHSTSSNTSRMTAPTAGFYNVSGSIVFATSGTGERRIGFRKNGAATQMGENALASSSASFGQALTSSMQVYLNAGDYIELAAFQNSGGSLNLNFTQDASPYLSISKVAGGGGSVGGSTVPDSAKMARAAAQSINNSLTKIAFDTKEYDVGGIADTTNTRFNIQKAGRYQVNALAHLSLNATQYGYLFIYKNGASVYSTIDTSPATGYDTSLEGNTILNLNAGDYLEMYVLQVGSTQNTVTGVDARPQMSVAQLDSPAGFGTDTLQSAYNNTGTAGSSITTTDGKDFNLTLADTTTDANAIINIANGSTGKFAVQIAGVDAFNVSGQTGAAVFKNATNSTTAFQIQNQAGSSNLFIADTTNNRIAVGQATANYKLDINGDVNVTSGSVFRVNGVAGTSATCSGGQFFQNQAVAGGITTAGTCTAGSGSSSLQGAYGVGNTITTTDARDINITLANTTTDSNFLVNVASGSTSKFAVQANSADTFSIGPTGDALFKNTSSTALQIQDGSANKLLVADTSGMNLYVGDPTADANARLLVLDSKNTTADPTCVNGAMYYNSSTGTAGQAKICINSTWTAIGVPRVTSLPATPSDGDEVYYAVGTTIRHMRYSSSLAAWQQISIGGTTSAKATRAVIDSVNSSSVNQELNAGYRVNVPAVAGDVIEGRFAIYISNATNITNFAFGTLNTSNAVVNNYPGTTGSFNPFFYPTSYIGVGQGVAQFKVAAGDIRPDGTVTVTILVHTGGTSRDLGATTINAFSQITNMGQIGP